MHTFPRGMKRTLAMVALALLFLCVPLSQAEAPANLPRMADSLTPEEYEGLIGELDANIQASLAQRVEDDAAVFEDEMETAGLGFVNGVPGADAVAWYDALATAIDAITAKYGLTDADLDQFTAMLSYNVADPDAPLWQIDLTPTDASRQLELGMYGANIYAKTGEIRNVHSHEDSVG